MTNDHILLSNGFLLSVKKVVIDFVEFEYRLFVNTLNIYTVHLKLRETGFSAKHSRFDHSNHDFINV